MEDRARGVASLDLMRLCAAVMVVLYHYLYYAAIEPAGAGGIRDVIGRTLAFPALAPAASIGWIGVEVFFTISGIVILMSAEGQSATEFLKGRVLRVVPGLVAFSALAALVLLACGVLPPATIALRLAKAAVLFPIGPWVDGAVWTLVAEAVFYALVFGSIIGAKRIEFRTATRLLLAFDLAWWLAVLLGHAGMLGTAGAGLPALAGGYRAQVTLLSTNCFFLLGIFAHALWREGAGGGRVAALALALACSFVAVWCIASQDDAVRRLGQPALLPATCWLIVTVLCGGLMLWERRHPWRPESRMLARRIGMMTYPLYLFHQISGAGVIRLANGLGATPEVAVLVAFTVALAVSDGFAMRIEPRLRKMLRRALDAV